MGVQLDDALNVPRVALRLQLSQCRKHSRLEQSGADKLDKAIEDVVVRTGGRNDWSEGSGQALVRQSRCLGLTSLCKKGLVEASAALLGLRTKEPVYMTAPFINILMLFCGCAIRERSAWCCLVGFCRGMSRGKHASKVTVSVPTSRGPGGNNLTCGARRPPSA